MTGRGERRDLGMQSQHDPKYPKGPRTRLLYRLRPYSGSYIFHFEKGQSTLWGGGGVGVVETLLTNYLYAMSQTIEYLLGESQIPGPQKYVEY